jgi:hypothetical protein
VVAAEQTSVAAVQFRKRYVKPRANLWDKMDRDKEKPNVDNMIDDNLRKVYDSVLQEEVPDRFSKLLEQLRSGETRTSEESEREGGPDR